MQMLMARYNGFHQHMLVADGRAIEFYRKCGFERAGKTVPRNELLRSVWGYDSDTLTRTVDTHVASLRQKLEKNPKQPEFIFTVSGVGYKFIGQDSK